MNRLGKMIVRGGMIASCSFLLLSSIVSASFDQNTSYIGDNRDASIAVPSAKPLWTYEMDATATDEAIGKGIIATGEGKVFYIQNGQMIAVDSITGKRAWKYGGNLKGNVQYNDGKVYVSTNTGYIHAVNAASGKKIWATTEANTSFKSMVFEGDQLFIMHTGIEAFSLKDGKAQWSANYNEIMMGEKIMVVGDMVLTVNAEGTMYEHPILLAFHKKTGKLAWRLPYHMLPIDARNGTMLSQVISNVDDKKKITTLATISIQTGKVIKTVKFNPLKINLNADSYSSVGQVWIKDGIVYISFGSKVFSYLENGDGAAASKTAALPQEMSSAGSYYAAGPHDGKMIFTDGKELSGVKLANNMNVYYHEGLSGSIARFDLIGHGMYVAQSNGTMLAIDLVTTKSISKFETGGRVFGPTLEENGVMIVQTRGKLLAFQQPTVLKA